MGPAGLRGFARAGVISRRAR